MRHALGHDEHCALRGVECAVPANDLIFAFEDVKDLVCAPVQMQRRTALRWTHLLDDGVSALRLIAGHLAGDGVADEVPCRACADSSDDGSWSLFWHWIHS